MEDETPLVQMFVAGIAMDPASNAPIIILKDQTGLRAIPIWIGLAEASSIASSLKNIQPARPMTHDLLKSSIENLGGSMLRLIISGIRDNTFLASLEILQGESLVSLDCRPSDGLALAVRSSAPVFVAEDVLAEAQVTISEALIESVEDSEQESEENFANIDKDRWAQILSSMDPDDFKYKM